MKKMQRRKADTERVQHRAIEVDLSRADAESRVIPATLSSEMPVQRWFGTETLRHTEESVDLARAKDGLPLLWNHDSDVFLGAVRNIRVADGKLKGELHFSQNARAQEVYNDVAAGLLRNMSVGYRIEDYEENSSGDVTATRWSLHEASCCPVPADPSVGANRQEENPKMTTLKSDAAEEARKAEIDRIRQIREVFNVQWQLEDKHIELRERMIAEEATVDETRKEFLDLLGIDSRPANQASSQPSPAEEGGLRKMMTEAIQCRAGTLDREAQEKIRGNNEFTGLSLVEMARAWLRINGLEHRGDAMTIVGRALTIRAVQDTTAFPNILMDAAHNALLTAYWDAPETWDQWCSQGNVQDFKINHRSNLSEFDTLPVVAEGGTYTDGSFSDLSENIQLQTYGKLWHITRESIINDSLSAFSRAPTAMGQAAARTVGDVAYAALTSNPTLNQDGETLFTDGLPATRDANDLAAAAITMASVDAAKVALALFTGPKGLATLGTRPGYLLTSIAKESTARQLLQAEYDPATTAGTLAPNTVRGLATVVSDHRLDAANPLTWYMASSPMERETIEVAFLNGNRTPFQERRQEDISNDNISYKVRIDVAAAPMDWRGLIRNVGA